MYLNTANIHPHNIQLLPSSLRTHYRCLSTSLCDCFECFTRPVAVLCVCAYPGPETFCLSTTKRDTTLCWKNPMPGRDDQTYVVLVQGQNLVIHEKVEADGDAEEFCISTSQMQHGQNYTFRVTLETDDRAGVELTFQNLGQGQLKARESLGLLLFVCLVSRLVVLLF